MLKSQSYLKKSFDGLVVRFQQISIALIYRPPYSKKHPVQIHTFLDEFVEILPLLLQESSQPIIIGDINVLWNLPEQTPEDWLKY